MSVKHSKKAIVIEVVFEPERKLDLTEVKVCYQDEAAVRRNGPSVALPCKQTLTQRGLPRGLR